MSDKIGVILNSSLAPSEASASDRAVFEKLSPNWGMR